MSFIGVLLLARLLHHFDKHFSSLRRIRNFSKESDARSLHAILGFQDQMEAKTIVVTATRLDIKLDLSTDSVSVKK